jgi:predicted transposase YbfD/YdcC
MERFAGCFAELADPREDNARHDLHEILMIAFCAMLCGAEDCSDMALFGRAKQPFLRQFLRLRHGIPSHDTFSRVFRLLDPVQFHACFLRFMEDFAAAARGVIAVDGKTLRRSFDRAANQSPLHLVSAWAVGCRLLLGQVATDEKSNEITAVPKLLEMLSLKGAIVTADALNCQRSIAAKVVDKGGDYVLALKGNQGSLFEDVRLFLDDAQSRDFREVEHQFHRTFDAEHGRQETRRYWCTGEVEWLRERHGSDAWAGLASIGMVESRRRNGGPATPETRERRYYISSLPVDRPDSAVRFAGAVRGHWGIENGVHWVLDLAFREDESRVRRDHAPQNLATLRHLALNLLRREPTSRRGIKARIRQACWNDDYLVRLLAQS